MKADVQRDNLIAGRTGVRSELVPLMMIPKIGRVRARVLYDSGTRLLVQRCLICASVISLMDCVCVWAWEQATAHWSW